MEHRDQGEIAIENCSHSSPMSLKCGLAQCVLPGTGQKGLRKGRGMPAKQCRVKLIAEEQQEPKSLVSRGRAAVYPSNGKSNLVDAVCAVGKAAPCGSDRPDYPGQSAWIIRKLVDVDYLDKDRIALVMDILNTLQSNTVAMLAGAATPVREQKSAREGRGQPLDPRLSQGWKMQKAAPTSGVCPGGC